MPVDASQLAQAQDPDLVRWARELGVTYQELVSTLNYAGPTFKDIDTISRAATPGSPKDIEAPYLPGARNTQDAPSPDIAAARDRPR